jgi:uncharacterized membrane protein YoaK (UPF0700 family)
MPSSSLRPALLALVAGWVDAIGLLQANIFAGPMTGNTTVLGLSLAQAKWHQATWLGLTIATFVCASVAARWATRQLGSPRWAILAATTLMLLATLARTMPRDMLLLAAATALANSASLHYGKLGLNIAFVTGDLAKAADATADAVAPGPTQPRSTIPTVAALWAYYALGATAGTVAQTTLQPPLLPQAWCVPLLPLSLLLP